jgi:hypothetical protein
MGSSIVTICSFLVLFICSKIATIVVDLPEPVGHVTRINHCFKVGNIQAHLGNQSFSTVKGSFSIFLRTNAGFHILKNQFILNDILSSFVYEKSTSLDFINSSIFSLSQRNKSFIILFIFSFSIIPDSSSLFSFQSILILSGDHSQICISEAPCFTAKSKILFIIYSF